MVKTIVAVFLCFTISGILRVASNPVQVQETTCGYDSCHVIDENKINVHLVPHSHDDLGWLKTVDQYYYGNKREINTSGVQYIITSVVEALQQNADRRFIQVETGFLWKWWHNQDDKIKKDVIDLINNGQLEIINGAWSMNDEAATNYQSIIDQYTWGLRFLNDTFGSCARPRAGWQIDPFGHSSEQASILSQLGFDGLFIGRLDYRDKDKRRDNKALDFLWQSSANLDNPNLFTSIFPDFYLSPSGYCWDIDASCSDDPINDDKESPDYNLDFFVEDFSNKILDYVKYYQTNNVLIPMGGDFQYQGAEANYLNLDRLIKGFKDNDMINVIYSTPSCYIKAVNEEAVKNSIKFLQKTDDFFPHATDPHAFWTGYYTSRPNFKRFERMGNNILQAAKQLVTISKVNGNNYDEHFNNLREVMGIAQHHDAITGTAKQVVSQDYTRLLTKAIEEAEGPIGAIIGDLLKKETDQSIDLQLKTCLLANVSICDATQGSRFVVAVYNPLARPITHYVQLPVKESSYKIIGPDGDEPSDVLDSISSFDYIPDVSISPKKLVFEAKNIPALGLKLYYIEEVEDRMVINENEDNINSYYGTNTTGFILDTETSKLKSVIMNGLELEITQEFLFYNSANGDNNVSNDQWERRASGAYIFKPFQNTTEAEVVSHNIQSVTEKRGVMVDEVKQIINDRFTQIIRVYKGNNNNYIEFDWLLGDLEADPLTEVGREIITRFTVKDFNNDGVFYTDSNGREILKRVHNKRNDFEYDPSEEPIASNYYPVTSKIVIKDEIKKLQVTVLNDRAQGGSSLKNGVIELMVHRRILKDDGFGVDEALDEMEFGKGVYVRGQHYLILGTTENTAESKSTAAQERNLAQQKLLAPWILVADATAEDLTLANLQNIIDFTFSGLKKSLPENVHLLTLEPWKDDTYLLRLEHFLEENEDEVLSKPVTVDLKGLFANAEISEIKETTLGANQWLEDYENQKKFVWESSDISSLNKEVTTDNNMEADDDPLKIILNPMQIRTFVIKIAKPDDDDNDDDGRGSCNAIRPLSFIILLIITFYNNYCLA